MKKLITLFLFAVILSLPNVLNAQTIMTQTDPAGVAATVNTNADTSFHKTDLAGQTNNFHVITIAVAGTKTSGTVGGNCVLQGSLDNSRWFTLTDSSGTGSQTLTDASVDLQWRLVNTRYRYYRVRVITSGTQVSSYVCRLLGRKVAN